MSPKAPKSRVVSGSLTVRAEANNPDGLHIVDENALEKFKKSVEKPKVLNSKGSGFTLTKAETCPHFMSKGSGLDTSNHRIHELIAMYPVTLKLDKDADIKRVAEEFTLFAMWHVEGFNPTSFSVMLCTDSFEVITAGDTEPDTEGEVQDE